MITHWGDLVYKLGNCTMTGKTIKRYVRKAFMLILAASLWFGRLAESYTDEKEYIIKSTTINYGQNYATRIYNATSLAPMSGKLGVGGACTVSDSSGAKGKFTGSGIRTGVLHVASNKLQFNCSTGTNFTEFGLKAIGLFADNYLQESFSFTNDSQRFEVAPSSAINVDKNSIQKWTFDSVTYCHFSFNFTPYNLDVNDLLLVYSDDGHAKENRWHGGKATEIFETSGRRAFAQMQSQGHGVRHGNYTADVYNCLPAKTEASCNETVHISIGDEDLIQLNASPFDVLYVADSTLYNLDKLSSSCRTSPPGLRMQFALYLCPFTIQAKSTTVHLQYNVRKLKPPPPSKTDKRLRYPVPIDFDLPTGLFFEYLKNYNELGNLFSVQDTEKKLKLLGHFYSDRNHVNLLENQAGRLIARYDETVYVELSLQSVAADSYVILQMHKCWITPDKSFINTVNQTLFENSFETKPGVAVSRNNRGGTASFLFKGYEWKNCLGRSEVHVHCIISVCNDNVNKNCKKQTKIGSPNGQEASSPCSELSKNFTEGGCKVISLVPLTILPITKCPLKNDSSFNSYCSGGCDDSSGKVTCTCPPEQTLGKDCRSCKADTVDDATTTSPGQDVAGASVVGYILIGIFSLILLIAILCLIQLMRSRRRCCFRKSASLKMEPLSPEAKKTAGKTDEEKNEVAPTHTTESRVDEALI